VVGDGWVEGVECIVCYMSGGREEGREGGREGRRKGRIEVEW